MATLPEGEGELVLPAVLGFFRGHLENTHTHTLCSVTGPLVTMLQQSFVLRGDIPAVIQQPSPGTGPLFLSPEGPEPRLDLLKP